MIMSVVKSFKVPVVEVAELTYQYRWILEGSSSVHHWIALSEEGMGYNLVPVVCGSVE